MEGWRRRDGPARLVPGLIVASALLPALLFLGLWLTERGDAFPDLLGLHCLPPLLGGAIGTGRLWRTREPGWRTLPRERYRIAFAFLTGGILVWGVSEFGLFFLARDGVVEIPSILDIGYGTAILCWTAFVFLLYEGSGDDFLDKANLDMPTLTLIAALNLTILSTAHGREFLSYLFPESETPTTDSLAVWALLDLTYAIATSWLAWMTLRLAHRRGERAPRHGRGALWFFVAGMLLLYAADLWAALAEPLAARQVVDLLLAGGPLPDFAYLAATACLALAAWAYPLGRDLFVPGNAGER